jgi:hypothetical protein
VVSGFCAALGWIRTAAQNAVQNERFLRELGQQIRPTCIFDSRGTMMDRIGTEDYIDRIVSTPSPTNSGYLFLIKGKRYIEHAPIITALNVSLYPESLSRTPGTPNDWTVLMSPQITYSVIGAAGGMDTNVVYQFRLEILH